MTHPSNATPPSSSSNNGCPLFAKNTPKKPNNSNKTNPSSPPSPSSPQKFKESDKSPLPSLPPTSLPTNANTPKPSKLEGPPLLSLFRGGPHHHLGCMCVVLCIVGRGRWVWGNLGSYFLGNGVVVWLFPIKGEVGVEGGVGEEEGWGGGQCFSVQLVIIGEFHVGLQFCLTVITIYKIWGGGRGRKGKEQGEGKGRSLVWFFWGEKRKMFHFFTFVGRLSHLLPLPLLLQGKKRSHRHLLLLLHSNNNSSSNSDH